MAGQFNLLFHAAAYMLDKAYEPQSIPQLACESVLSARCSRKTPEMAFKIEIKGIPGDDSKCWPLDAYVSHSLTRDSFLY